MDLRLLAKYPFLSNAKAHVNSLKLNLGELEKHPIYSAAVNLGRQRVLDAVNNNITEIPDDELSLELSILSYPLARIFVNVAGKPMLTSRYAAGEANQAYYFLGHEKPEVIEKISNDLGFEISAEGLRFQDYLKLTSELAKADPKFRLVNRPVKSGFVSIDEKEKVSLLREFVRLKVLEPVDARGVPESFKKIAKGLAGFGARTADELKVDAVNKNALPGCVVGMLERLRNGEASHNVMFILATFFINLGLKKDAMVEIFSTSPKFDEKTTSYQLEFLSGEKSGTKYTCPACATIKSYGLCPKDCGVKHPLQYYRKNQRRY